MGRNMLKEYPVEDLPRYYKRIREYFEMKMPHSNLAAKADLGSNRSEKGYQLIAASTCSSIAKILGADEHKAVALSLTVGQCFPKYGLSGLEAIKEYIIKNNINLDCETIGADLAENIIGVRLFVATDLIEKLRQYYHNDNSDLEVSIVHFVQQTIKEVKIAEEYYDGYPGDLLFNVTEEIKTLTKENGKLTSSQILEKYRAQIDTYELPKLSDSQKEEIFSDLDRYIKVFKDETPETAILIYIES